MHSFLGEANDHLNLGQLYAHTNRLAEAQDALTSALRLHMEVHSSLGEANDNGQLGDLYLSTGRLVEAMTSLQRALQIYEQIGDNLGKANALRTLGGLHLGSDRFQDAEDAFSQAFNLHEEIQDYAGARWALRHLVSLYIKLGRDEDAAGALQKLIKRLRCTPYTDELAKALQLLGFVDIRMGRLDEAETSLREALQLHEGLEDEDEEIARDHELLDELHLMRVDQEVDEQYVSSDDTECITDNDKEAADVTS